MTRSDRVLGGLIALALIVPFLALVFGLLLPFWIAALGLGLPLAAWRDRRDRDPIGLRLGRFLGTAVLAPIVVAGVGAPFRLASALALRWLPPWPVLVDLGGPGLVAYPRFDFAVGICGILLAGVGGILEIRRLGTIRKALENLPRSKARSAALGLAEFRGVVRPLPNPSGAEREVIDRGHAAALGAPPPQAVLYSAAAAVGNAARHLWSQFHLEDETGRILVDPRGAEFWDGSGSMLAGRLFRICLPVTTEMGSLPGAGGRPFQVPVTVQALAEGDRAYLIGSVETNRHAPPGATGSGRLVVRPSRELREARGFEWLLRGLGARVRRSGDWHLFFLAAEADEGRILGFLGTAARWSAIAAAAWASLSLGLVLLNRTGW